MCVCLLHRLLCCCFYVCVYSRDCPIFYMRSKVKKDLQQAQKELERFDEMDW